MKIPFSIILVLSSSVLARVTDNSTIIFDDLNGTQSHSSLRGDTTTSPRQTMLRGDGFAAADPSTRPTLHAAESTSRRILRANVRSQDGRYEALPVGKHPNIHYEVRDRSTGSRLFTTRAQYRTPNDVKAGAFLFNSKLFAAAYHYGHDGGYTWIGIYDMRRRSRIQTRRRSGWVRDLSFLLNDQNLKQLFGNTGNGVCGNSIETEVLRLVNKERTSRGIKAVKCDKKLQAGARAHSDWMCKSGKFEHADGFFENIAWGYGSAAATVQGWMRSKGHRENILRRSMTRAGAGYHAGCNRHWTLRLMR